MSKKITDITDFVKWKKLEKKETTAIKKASPLREANSTTKSITMTKSKPKEVCSTSKQEVNSTSKPQEVNSKNNPKEACSMNNPKEACSMNNPKEVHSMNNPKEACSMTKSIAESADLSKEKKQFPLEISWKSGKMSTMIREVEEFILKNNDRVQVYRYNGRLVRIFFNEKDDRFEVENLDFRQLINHISKFITFKKELYRGRIKDINLPVDVSITICKARADSLIPELRHVFWTPTLLLDGTLLQKSGYDAKRKIFMAFSERKFQKIKENLTIADAMESYSKIMHLFQDFIFTTKRDRAVAVNMLFTMVVKPFLKSGSPLFGLTSHLKSSGKGTLIKVCALIATGKEAHMINYQNSRPEDERTLIALLKERNRCVFIDQVPHNKTFESDPLCAILTNSTISSRTIRTSSLTTLSTTETVFTATGRYLTLGGDLTGRSLLCSLTPTVENPEYREYAIPHIEEYALEHHPEYLVCVLTILKAYLDTTRNEYRQDLLPWRFPHWEMTRRACMWIGLEDPCSSQNTIIERDPLTQSATPLFDALYNKYKSAPFAIRDLAGLNGIEELLLAFAGEREFDAWKLSRKFSTLEGTTQGNLKLFKHTSAPRIQWKLERLGKTPTELESEERQKNIKLQKEQERLKFERMLEKQKNKQKS